MDLDRKEIAEYKVLVERARNYIIFPRQYSARGACQWSRRVQKWLDKNLSQTNLPNKFQFTIEPVDKAGKGLSSTDVNKIKKKLEILSAVPQIVPTLANLVRSQIIEEDLNKVFIVHGHDYTLRDKVSKFVSDLGLSPVVLQEQANKGRTVFTKLIDHSNVGFAIVLLTPDDRGGKAESSFENLNFRARQNVILEFGYFVAKLGLGNVCVLYDGNVEIPSDYHGVLYIHLDEKDAWKSQVTKEIKAAGIRIDDKKVK
jgi:predicted nucleotide-binding protein